MRLTPKKRVENVLHFSKNGVGPDGGRERYLEKLSKGKLYLLAKDLNKRIRKLERRWREATELSNLEARHKMLAPKLLATRAWLGEIGPALGRAKN